MSFVVFLVTTYVLSDCSGQGITPPMSYHIIQSHQRENITETSDDVWLRQVLSEPDGNTLETISPADPQSSMRTHTIPEHTSELPTTDPAQKIILDGTLLRVYEDSIDKYHVVHLSRLEEILPHFELNANWVFVTFGFNESPESPGPREVVTALLETKKYSVALLDWSNHTSVGPVGDLAEAKFIHAIDSAQTIGCGLGKILVAINKTGVDIRSRVVALVGHDFGAQIMGEAATCALINHIEMRLVWGLDPAGWLYNSIFGPLPPLHYGVAEYVYSIHTDPHGFGSNDEKGTVDFWLNFKSPGYIRQPGCPGEADKYSTGFDSLCNHQRAWYVFADGIRNPESMPAVNAKRSSYWRSGHTVANSPLAYITIEPVPGAKGQYFLRTRSKAPFGLYMVGVIPQNLPNLTLDKNNS